MPKVKDNIKPYAFADSDSIYSIFLKSNSPSIYTSFNHQILCQLTHRAHNCVWETGAYLTPPTCRRHALAKFATLPFYLLKNNEEMFPRHTPLVLAKMGWGNVE